MRVENIIWDWNGTIVDDAWVFVSIMNGFLKNNNLPSTSLVAYRKNFCFPIQDYWKNLGFQFNKKDFDRLNKDFISEYQKKLFSPKLHRGIKSLLHYIKKQNVNQFVLSASEQATVPTVFALEQNYPNPFNPITSLRYDLPNDGLVNITIYDMMGRIVKTLVNSSQTAGFKYVQWNATNDRDEPVSAGLYLYTIQAGEFRQTKKMILLK